MAKETELTRELGVQIAEEAGWNVSIDKKGNRFIAQLEKSGREVQALVKVASRGSAMVRADRDDADTATISGFADDVSHVLFCIRLKLGGDVHVFLVPIDVVEKAYRDTHRAWRQRVGPGKENLTWVIWFQEETGDLDCRGYAEKWAEYKLGEIAEEAVPRSLTVDEARAGLAKQYNVKPEKVRITIEF